MGHDFSGNRNFFLGVPFFMFALKTGRELFRFRPKALPLITVKTMTDKNWQHFTVNFILLLFVLHVLNDSFIFHESCSSRPPLRNLTLQPVEDWKFLICNLDNSKMFLGSLQISFIIWILLKNLNNNFRNFSWQFVITTFV